jgi:hypothetical protein
LDNHSFMICGALKRAGRILCVVRLMCLCSVLIAAVESGLDEWLDLLVAVWLVDMYMQSCEDEVEEADSGRASTRACRPRIGGC